MQHDLERALEILLRAHNAIIASQLAIAEAREQLARTYKALVESRELLLRSSSLLLSIRAVEFKKRTREKSQL